MPRQIPQGIEVLVHKAAVDAEFKQFLLEHRAEAAARIGLELAPAETSMLAAVPRQQLEVIIARTSVPQEHRRAFLGQAAAAMLAALGVVGTGETIAGCGGIRPQPDNGRVIGGFGIQPDRPAEKPEKDDEVEARVLAVIAKQFKLKTSEVEPKKDLVKDFKAKTNHLIGLRKNLEKEFKIKIPADKFKNVRTVGDVVNCVQQALDKQAGTNRRPARQPVDPYRPRLPPGSGLGGIAPGM
jgi:acyl carrier protein